MFVLAQGRGRSGWFFGTCLCTFSLLVSLCTGDSCLKPVNSRCVFQGARHGFTSAEFGFLISPDCQIPLQTYVNGTITDEYFRLKERIVGCLFSKKYFPESEKPKKNLTLVLTIILWVFEAKELHYASCLKKL